MYNTNLREWRRVAILVASFGATLGPGAARAACSFTNAPIEISHDISGYDFGTSVNFDIPINEPYTCDGTTPASTRENPWPFPPNGTFWGSPTGTIAGTMAIDGAAMLLPANVQNNWIYDPVYRTGNHVVNYIRLTKQPGYMENPGTPIDHVLTRFLQPDGTPGVTIRLHGAWHASGCSIDPTVDIELADSSPGQLATPGQTAGYGETEVLIVCPYPLQLYMMLEGDGVLGTPGVIRLDGDPTGNRGIGIRLYMNGAVTPLNQNISFPRNTNHRVRIGGEYYRTGTTPTIGDVRATATYTITYN
uniref:fimbrial protein n=1 Tax=Serratia proteamaculans TaxID=28151 RepID=UPI003B67E0C2|nr:fimbrial protein [Serratia proteamaculans]